MIQWQLTKYRPNCVLSLNRTVAIACTQHYGLEGIQFQEDSGCPSLIHKIISAEYKENKASKIAEQMTWNPWKERSHRSDHLSSKGRGVIWKWNFRLTAQGELRFDDMLFTTQCGMLPNSIHGLLFISETQTREKNPTQQKYSNHLSLLRTGSVFPLFVEKL